MTILCKSREMVARVRTSKVFDGKIYAKSKPNLCVNDISSSLEFEINMRYHDVDCDVKEATPGHFSSDIVIQHHDRIVTTKDLGLSIHCKYDLSNRSITNNVNLAVDGWVYSFLLFTSCEACLLPLQVLLRETYHNFHPIANYQLAYRRSASSLALCLTIQSAQTRDTAINVFSSFFFLSLQRCRCDRQPIGHCQLTQCDHADHRPNWQQHYLRSGWRPAHDSIWNPRGNQ